MSGSHARRHVDQAVGHDRARRRRGSTGPCSGLKPPARQSSAPVAGIVAGDVVGAADDDLFLVVVAQQRGCRVGVGRFGDGVGRPLDPPARLAGARVDGEHVGRVVGLHPVQHLDVERALVEQRRRRVAPVQAERPVVLLDVARPEFLAGEVERLQHAGAGHHPHARAVGDGRGRRHVLLAHLRVARAEVRLPSLGARVAVDAHEVQLGALGDVQEDTVVPDDGRRAREVRQRQLPGDVLGGRPRDGQVLLVGDAVHRRSAPLRPVPGRGRRPERPTRDRRRQSRGAWGPHFPNA